MKTSTHVTKAFLNGTSKKDGNKQTDGKIFLLFGNRIAEHRNDGLYITNCGYFTDSTKRYLNTLPNVSIHQKNYVWYLNGVEWDGNWIKVSDEVVEQKKSPNKGIFDTSTTYVKTDGWRGYSKPIYAVCGANDTGSWSDSPCPSNVCNEELQLAKTVLNGIPTKTVTCETSNVFCVHRYIVVPVDLVDVAREKIAAFLETEQGKNTRLLYAVN